MISHNVCYIQCWAAHPQDLPCRPCYPWTRKVKGTTVCVALSKEQYEWLEQAIVNWRRVQQILRQMRRLSREELFQCVPGPTRRKKSPHISSHCALFWPLLARPILHAQRTVCATTGRGGQSDGRDDGMEGSVFRAHGLWPGARGTTPRARGGPRAGCGARCGGWCCGR